jgi:hypothetical protein
VCVCDRTSGHICLHISLGIQICLDVMFVKRCLIQLFIDLVQAAHSNMLSHFLPYPQLLFINSICKIIYVPLFLLKELNWHILQIYPRIL